MSDGHCFGTISEIKKAYVKTMVMWKMHLIETYIKQCEETQTKWVLNIKEAHDYICEQSDALEQLRGHVKKTVIAGSSAGLIGTGFTIAALATLVFPPVSLGLSVTGAAIGIGGAVANIGKLMIFIFILMYNPSVLFGHVGA